MHKVSEVFVPGGLPKFTYNPREERKLEEKLSESKENLCKLVILTGLTKSGKTVLAQKIFPRNGAIWFDGGAFSNEEEFWLELNSKIGNFTEHSESKSNGGDASVEAGAEVEGGIVVVKGKGHLQTRISGFNEQGLTKTRRIGGKTAALQGLSEKHIPLIIDDFHFIPREKQGNIIRSLKSLVFDGLPVVFIAIPHRHLDVVKSEREMTLRTHKIDVPAWSIDELRRIPDSGFPLLNVDVSDKIKTTMAENAFGSPHLMQEFCRELCEENNIKETLNRKIILIDESILPQLFKKIAENTGKSVFEKLSRGPRTRTDRKPRILKNGKQTDIYGLVLHALAFIKPGIQTISYEDIRAAIKEISLTPMPQSNQVSNALEHMSKISTSDESSTPVIDWDENDGVLHITDPFFAYYLKWGADQFKI